MTGPPIKITWSTWEARGGCFSSTVVSGMTEAAVSSVGRSVKCDHFDIQRAQSLRLEAGSQSSKET